MTDHFDTFLQVRLTTHDKERIKARALEAGMQTSEYVRKRALAQSSYPKPSRDPYADPNPEVIGLLSRNAAENMGSVDCPVVTRPEEPSDV